jgi:arylsulfatase A-like enzyme
MNSSYRSAITTPVVALVAVFLAGCGGTTSALPSIRLVDLVSQDSVEAAALSASKAKPLALWRAKATDGAASDEGAIGLASWKAADGVGGLTMRDGKLVGRSTSAIPLIYAELPKNLDADDSLSALEVRMRVSAGANVSGAAYNHEKLNAKPVIQAAEEGNHPFTSPVNSALGLQSLTMNFRRAGRIGSLKMLYLRPSDAPNAEFEIESIRLVTRKERLAAIPSGVGWQGLSDIFRESIVTRSPETLKINLDVPQNAWLDLNLGTVEQGAVKFQLAAAPVGTARDQAEILLEQTVTTPHRWNPVEVDLSKYAGRAATLFLALDVPQERTIGIWGSPAVRVRGARPAAPAKAASALGNSRRPRNVLLIMCDTLRRDHLNFYGYGRETAPAIARLASEGTTFTDNISPSSWTKVSTTSIMTSLYPTSHRVANVPDRLSAAATTMAEIYRDAGYATLAYSSVPFSGQLTNLHQGYEELHERSSVSESGSKTAREYVDRFLGWLDRHPDTPFFTFLHVFDPHSPFEPRDPYGAMWADSDKRQEHIDQREKSKPFIKSDFLKGMGLPRRTELEKAKIDPGPYIEYDKDWYDGSIRGMDSEMARVVERLRQLGQLENTVIAFFSDHGEEFHEHDGMFHGFSIYGEMTNVPLALYWPGVIPAGLQISETVSTIDMMPTVLELSGLPVPPAGQGKSLLPLIAAARDHPEA